MKIRNMIFIGILLTVIIAFVVVNQKDTKKEKITICNSSQKESDQSKSEKSAKEIKRQDTMSVTNENQDEHVKTEEQ